MAVYIIKRISDGLYVGVPNKSYVKNKLHAWFFSSKEKAEERTKEGEIVQRLKANDGLS